MSFSSIKQQLYNWFVQQSAFPGSQVIFVRQGEPRPPRPYATIHVGAGARKIGLTDDVRMTGQSLSISGQRELTCSINVFGADAMETLARVKDSLELPEVVDTFNSNGMAITDASEITDLSELEETNYQQRAQINLIVQYVSTVEDPNTSTIEHSTVNLTGTPYSVPSTTDQVN